MHPDDRRVDAWEASPGPIVLVVMALTVLVALPFAALICLKDLLLPAEDGHSGLESKSSAARTRQ